MEFRVSCRGGYLCQTQSQRERTIYIGILREKISIDSVIRDRKLSPGIALGFRPEIAYNMCRRLATYT